MEIGCRMEAKWYVPFQYFVVVCQSGSRGGDDTVFTDG